MPDSNTTGSASAALRSYADPTVLTTEALQREVAAISREFELRQNTRQRENEELKELILDKVAGLRDLTAEQNKAFEVQFNSIENHRIEQKKDTKDAVDAALISQKEAVREQTIASGLSIAKSEAATAKQLDQLAVTFSTAIAGVTVSINDLKDAQNSSIGDIKERIGRIENMKIGAQEHKANIQNNMGIVYSAAAFVLILLTIFITLVSSGAFTK